MKSHPLTLYFLLVVLACVALLANRVTRGRQ